MSPILKHCKGALLRTPRGKVHNSISNPDNASPKGGFCHDPLCPPAPSSLALSQNKKWTGNGVRLRVVFIDNPPPSYELQERTVKHMNGWSQICNVSFILLPSLSNDHTAAAEVRISFSGKVKGKVSGGCWSYIGTEVLVKADRQEPTMMLEGLDAADISDDKFMMVVLHETGHTLGFVHEHRRPEIANLIDPVKAYIHFQPWDESKVDAEVLKPLSTNSGPSSCIASQMIDCHSIMCYPIPESIFKDDVNENSIEVIGGSILSECDKITAKVFYPIPKYRSKVLGKREVITPKKASYFLVKNGEVVGFLEVDQHLGERIIGKPIQDPQMLIRAASDGRLYIAEDGPAVTKRNGRLGEGWDGLKNDTGDQSINPNMRVELCDTSQVSRIKMYKWQGPWKELRKAADTRYIVSTNTHLYRQNNRGEIYQIPVKDPKFGWQRVDKFDDTVRITTSWRLLYQQRSNGEVWVYTGVDRCWTRVYQNQGPREYRIVAYEDRLFRVEEQDEPIKKSLFASLPWPRKCLPAESGAGVWVNDNNTEGGWKPLKIKQNWATFSYADGYVYESVMEGANEVKTRYTGIC
ncbi:hypothetical protein PM082_011849 [Marasmius tenuissimus]|nr:hypothetical protein PM082_011849 [Marasmius tenuissimus]